MKDTSEHACMKQFDVIHELGMYIITVGGLVTNTYKLCMYIYANYNIIHIVCIYIYTQCKL